MGFLRPHRFAVPMLLMGACCASSQGQTQASAARRYTSVQGIEMIQSRGVAMNRLTAASPSVAGGKLPTGAARVAPTSLTTSPYGAISVTVPPPSKPHVTETEWRF